MRARYRDVEKDFTGRIVVVTGAGSGIGQATARLFSRLGAYVHGADVDGGSVERLVAELGEERAAAHQLDVRDAAAVEAFAADVFARGRGVDVLHNNAGIGHAGEIEHTTIEDWDRVIGVNLLGVAYGVQAFAPRMLEQGRPASIVNTASSLGLVAMGRMAPYCASKFGVVGLTEALHAELAPRGLHVCAVCPGIIDTPITRNAVLRGQPGERREGIVGFYGKYGATADQVADAVVDAVRRNRVIAPVPRSQVSPAWWAKRASHRTGQVIARHMPRVVLGRGART
jgi:NAD(P)-dependent dehydrogenase (short-subunit alcohol dehydrogenase family)